MTAFTSGQHLTAKDSKATTRHFQCCVAITTSSAVYVTTFKTTYWPLAITKDTSNCGHPTLGHPTLFGDGEMRATL